MGLKHIDPASLRYPKNVALIKTANESIRILMTKRF